MSFERPYLALDPGTTGALALLCGPEVTVFDVPVIVDRTPHGKRSRLDLEALADLARVLAMFDPVAVAEKVAGRRGDNPFSIGELTRAAGAVEAALAAAGIPIAVHVQPADWKRHFGLTRIPKAERKGASLDLARSLWPSCRAFARVKDHNRAEAALIAEWARQQSTRSGSFGAFVAEKAQNVTDREAAAKRRRKKSKDTKIVFC